jgi:hypothetical protein
MKNDIVPYHIALDMKSIGFDEPCFAWYVSGSYGLEYGEVIKSDLIRDGIVAPTFSQAFRWFREKYNLFCEIQIDRTTEPKFCFDIFQYEHFGNYEKIEVEEWYLYRTQEEVELECLKKLIEIVKTNKI